MKDNYLFKIKDASVLIVDDDSNLLKSFKDVLELYVKNVYEAKDGLEALNIFNKEFIHIIISDIKMPNFNGLDFTTKIREINHDIPIIIVSAYSERELLLDFIKLNLTDFLVKPITHDTLLKALSRSAKILVDKKILNFYFSDDCFYNTSNKKIYKKTKEYDLTLKEVLLIELLIKNANKLVTKDMIQIEVYQNSYMTESALKNLVFKLRQKLMDDNIKTIIFQGYILNH